LYVLKKSLKNKIYLQLGLIFSLVIVLSCLTAREVWADSPPRFDFDQVLYRAIEVDDELENRRAEIELNEARYQDALREYFPEVTLTLEQQDHHDGLFIEQDDHYEHSYNARLVQRLWSGGRLGGRLNQTRASLKAARLGYRMRAAEVLERAANAYFDLLEAQMETEIQSALRTSVEESYRVASEKYEIGELTRVELLEVRQRRNEVNRRHSRALNELQKARIRLNRVLDRDFEASIFVTRGEFDADQEPPEELTDQRRQQSRAQLLDHSYSIRQQEQEVVYAEEGVALAQAHFLPDLSAEVDYDARGDDTFGADEDDYYVGLSMEMFFFGHSVQSSYQRDDDDVESSEFTMTFFDNRPDITHRISARDPVQTEDSLEVQTRQAEAMKTEAKNQLKETRKNEIEDLESLFYDWISERVDIINEIEELEYRDEQLHLTLTRDELGEVTILEVIEAQIAKSNAEIELMKSWFDFYFNQFVIDLMIGEVDVEVEEP